MAVQEKRKLVRAKQLCKTAEKAIGGAAELAFFLRPKRAEFILTASPLRRTAYLSDMRYAPK